MAADLVNVFDLEKPVICANITFMNKSTANRIRKLRKDGYAVAGVAPDGVVILRSRHRATHFTDKELAAAIAVVRSNAASALTQSSDRAPTKRK